MRGTRNKGEKEEGEEDFSNIKTRNQSSVYSFIHLFMTNNGTQADAESEKLRTRHLDGFFFERDCCKQ
jgi:hypothetical protein